LPDRFPTTCRHWIRIRRNHSFTRLFALIRSAFWQKLDLRSLLESYGTAASTPTQILKPIFKYSRAKSRRIQPLLAGNEK
jgi:hypothetical protein